MTSDDFKEMLARTGEHRLGVINKTLANKVGQQVLLIHSRFDRGNQRSEDLYLGKLISDKAYIPKGGGLPPDIVLPCDEHVFHEDRATFRGRFNRERLPSSWVLRKGLIEARSMSLLYGAELQGEDMNEVYHLMPGGEFFYSTIEILAGEEVPTFFNSVGERHESQDDGQWLDVGYVRASQLTGTLGSSPQKFCRGLQSFCQENNRRNRTYSNEGIN